MRVSGIQSTNYFNYSKPQSFKGYVNGNYYKDSIIEQAREALKNPKWKEELRRGKQSIETAVKEWHYEYCSPGQGDEKLQRIFSGIFTFGLSEVIMGSVAAIETATNNKYIEDTIDEVSRCLADLHHDPNGG